SLLEHIETDRGAAKPALMRLRQLLAPRRQDGQAMIEFALVLPILALIIFGIFDFGSAYNQANSLRFLANQAARYAEVNSCAVCNGQMIADYIPTTADTSSLQDPVDGAKISYCLPTGSDGSKGSALTVEASYSHDWL